jgi:hypothetical protein
VRKVVANLRWGASGDTSEPSADKFERLDMYIRKIAAAAGFATGAALAFAPFASADTPITSTVDSEIASLNSIFASQAAAAGVPAADVTTSATPGVFDTVLPVDAPQVTDPGQLTILDYELFGVNPIKAGIAGDPGSFSDFNGALGKFDDAYNVFLYAAQNGGAMDMHDADFIGSASSIDHAQTLTVTGAEQYFLNFGLGDLEGYYGIFPAPVAVAAAEAVPAAAAPIVDITSTVNGEIASMNALFVSEVVLAGDPATDVITHGANTFDTISLIDAPHTGTPTILDFELYGLNPIANSASDPGAFSEFNGALVNFDDAYNLELFSLLNPTAAVGDIPLADLFGSASGISEALATGTVPLAVTDFLTDGWADLTGFFTP